MKSLVGKRLPHAEGVLDVMLEIPKVNWYNEFSMNKSIKKVYGVLFNDTQKVQCSQLGETLPFKKFISEYKKRYKSNQSLNRPGSFDEVTEFAFDNGSVRKRIHFSDTIIEYFYDDYEITFAPWHDGVMLVDINVKDRSKGIGTKIINGVYDISEELGIPLYLIPYPGERFNPKDEKKLTIKLENWYRKLGFDKAVESNGEDWPKIWCNME
jgi:hypothetical protein